MENSLMRYVDSLVERYPLLAECKNDIIKSYDYLEKSYANNHKLLVCGMVDLHLIPNTSWVN